MIKKIFICIVILIIVLIVTSVVLLSSVNKPKGNNEKVLKGKDNSSKKALIIYQPAITNITDEIANSLAKGLNDKGYEVIINYPGDHLTTDVSKYDLVIFGSPVYAGQPSTVETDYISKVKDFSSNKVVLFSTGGDASKDSELEIMEKSLNGVKVYKKIKFNVSNKEESKNKAYNFGKELTAE